MKILDRIRKELSRVRLPGTSIRARFALMVALPVAIVYLSFQFMVVSQVESRAAEVARATLRERSVSSIVNLNSDLETVANLARQVARFLEVHPDLEESAIYDLVRAIVEVNPKIYGSAVAFEPRAYRPDRELFSPYAFRSGGGVRLMDIGDPDPEVGYDYTDPEWEWWNAPRDSGAAVWSEPYFDEGAGGIVMSTLSVPFRRDGAFRGVATVDLDLKGLVQILDVRESEVIIVSRQGRYIFHPDRARIMHRTLAADAAAGRPDLIALQRLMAAGAPGTITLEAPGSGTRSWAFVAPIPATGWMLASMVSEDEVLAFARTQTRRLALMLAATLVLIMICIWLGAGLVSRPIVRIQAAAEKLARGEPVGRLAVESNDEIGRLTRAFNSMAAEITRRREDLEREIEQRTQEVRDQRDLAEQARERLQDITDEIPGAVYQAEELPGGSPRFTFVSEGVQRIFRVPREEFMTRFDAPFRRIVREDIPRVRRTLLDSQERLAPWVEEFRLHFGDGSERWVQNGAVPQRRGDGAIVWNGYWIDVTERKHMEEQLSRAKTAAEAATRVKANFLAAMSHEIRTPMNGVLGMVDLLRQTEVTEEQRGMLQVISESGQSLLTIINDILDLSKIEAGRMEIERIPAALADIVEGSARTVSPNARRKGLRLITFIDPDLPSFVEGDPVRLRQILINLIGNAIKFTDSGSVVVRAERTGSEGGSVNVRFRVIDQGIGISPEGRARLFQAFSQAESSTTRKYGGTGLGLSICQRLVAMMNGEIGVESELGKGSEFWVRLSFPVVRRETEGEKVRDLAGVRVLMLVDNPEEAEICRRYLEFWNAAVTIHRRVDDVAALWKEAAAKQRPHHVLVHGPWSSLDRNTGLRESLRAQGCEGLKFVVLFKGRRSSARLAAPDTVCVDVDPLRRSTFLSAVAIAMGRASPEVHHEEAHEDLRAAGGPPTVGEAARQGRLILVAEDNETNRDVIRRQLNLLGFACELANDGKDALQAWRSGRHAVLLTDCHMPRMDGFELTDAIRREERGGGRRTPIVAITANALQGEADRCLAAGMDDYLSKPIDLKLLRQSLVRWLPAQDEGKAGIAPGAAVAATRAPRGNGGAIDESALRSVFGDDPAVFKEILDGFVGPSRRIVAEIKGGCSRRSAGEVKAAAHKLKSSARSIGAYALADLCTELEAAGGEGDWGKIDDRASNLDTLMREVEEYIAGL